MQGVANRDLKLENLLTDQDTDGKRPLLKICDFGYSKHEMNSSAKSGVGSPVFMAPEIVFSGNRYDAKVSMTQLQCLVLTKNNVKKSFKSDHSSLTWTMILVCNQLALQMTNLQRQRSLVLKACHLIWAVCLQTYRSSDGSSNILWNFETRFKYKDCMCYCSQRSSSTSAFLNPYCNKLMYRWLSADCRPMELWSHPIFPGMSMIILDYDHSYLHDTLVESQSTSRHALTAVHHNALIRRLLREHLEPIRFARYTWPLYLGNYQITDD